MKLGIYVGSFNPPHEGHHHVATYLLKYGYVDKVIMLPTPNYWDKQDLAPIKDRINMLSYYASENIIIDSTHNNFPFTYQVLESLKKDYPDSELYLIIGSDNLENFHLWQNLEEIFQYKILVLKRGNTDITKYINRFPTANFIVVPNFIFIDVSSSDIRNGLNNNYLDLNVQKYIRKHNLYK